MTRPATPTCGSCGQPAQRLTARLRPGDPKSSVGLEHEDCYAQLITALMIGETTARDLATRRAP